ncbi:MAG: hypothetical protein ACHQPI_08430 [Thermoanaerobaculia bacterium]
MMKAARRTTLTAADAEDHLRAFIDKFDSKDQQHIRYVRKAVRKRLPTANELVWDNYNFFVIGYSPTERPSDSIVLIPSSHLGCSDDWRNHARGAH